MKNNLLGFVHTFVGGATASLVVDLSFLEEGCASGADAHIVGPWPTEREIIDWEGEVLDEVGSRVELSSMCVDFMPEKANPEYLEFTFFPAWNALDCMHDDRWIA
jgi:hypothetical protein